MIYSGDDDDDDDEIPFASSPVKSPVASPAAPLEEDRMVAEEDPGLPYLHATTTATPTPAPATSTINQEDVVTQLREQISVYEGQLFSVLDYNERVAHDEHLSAAAVERLVERYKAGYDAVHAQLAASQAEQEHLAKALGAEKAARRRSTVIFRGGSSGSPSPTTVPGVKGGGEKDGDRVGAPSSGSPDSMHEDEDRKRREEGNVATVTIEKSRQQQGGHVHPGVKPEALEGAQRVLVEVVVPT